jgi:hypothetical protein
MDARASEMVPEVMLIGAQAAIIPGVATIQGAGTIFHAAASWVANRHGNELPAPYELSRWAAVRRQ